LGDITMTVGGNLPGGDANGLADMAKELRDKPKHVWTATVMLDVHTTRNKHDDDSAHLTIRLRRIEVVHDTDDRLTVERVMLRTFQERTNTLALPYDLRDGAEDPEAPADDVVEAEIVCGEKDPLSDWTCGLPDGHDGDHAPAAPEPAEEQDPAAGPWPGDPDFPAPDGEADR
jgi:hypothetical protein